MNRLFNLKKSNNGSALVSVIVIVAFISILATIVLYLAGTNYRSKVEDYKTKESFYETEEVIELARANLVIAVAKASDEAYSKTAYQYSVLATEENRREVYLKNFYDSFSQNWKGMWKESAPGAADGVENGITALFSGATVEDIVPGNESTFKITIGSESYDCTINEYYDDTLSDSFFRYQNAVSSVTSLYILDEDGKSTGKPSPIYVRNLKVTVTDPSSDYTSMIATTFKVVPPMFNWSDTEQLKMDASIPTSSVISKLDYSNCVTYVNWTKE